METLKRLQIAKCVNVPIIVNTDKKIDVNTVLALEKEGYVTIIQRFTNSVVVKVTSKVMNLRVTELRCHTKAKHWPVKIDQYLGKNCGHLIISTSSGIMLHNEAIKRKIGGVILGYVMVV